MANLRGNQVQSFNPLRPFMSQFIPSSSTNNTDDYKNRLANYLTAFRISTAHTNFLHGAMAKNFVNCAAHTFGQLITDINLRSNLPPFSGFVVTSVYE